MAAKKPPVQDDDAVAKSARDLARLQQQAEETRAELTRLRQEVADAESRLSQIAAAQIAEAKEQRVFTTLRARSDADAGAPAHGDLELREVNERLLLAALNAQELKAVAEQALQRHANSMAFVAHELRNPLTPLRVAAEMLSVVSADQFPRYQAIIEHEVDHLSRLVCDLIDVSRAGTGKLRLERRQVDMISLIDEVLESCRPAMDARLQHLSVQVPAGALELFGDPVRLAQVLRNLLDNASKYTPNSGKIELSVVVVADAMEITVCDNGIGITAEAVPWIFEPFVQDLPAVSFNGLGLGIGLAVVRELVEAHGGTVTAASAGSGLGSRFVVTLPLGVREAL